MASSESKTTTDHKTIRAWAEARDGKPATVKSTEKDGEAGILRIDFPGYSGAGSLEEISWNEFFQKFDEKKLAFLYQEHTSSGEESRFFKLVTRDSSSEKSSAHSSTKSEPKSEAKAEPKTESKAHKADTKDEAKSSAKAEHKTESKAHKADTKEEPKSTAKAEHKTESKAHKAEHKDDSKAHKAEEKPHKATKK